MDRIRSDRLRIRSIANYSRLIDNVLEMETALKSLRESLTGSIGLTLKEGQVTVKEGQITVRNLKRLSKETYPLAGAEARVESSGEIDRRRTWTRMALAGPFAPSKKTDRRELYLSIEGPTFQVALAVDPDHQKQARDFAAALSTRARQSVTTPQQLPPGGYAPPPSTPAPPAQPLPPPAVPAGWYNDPAGAPDLRYFDGQGWTTHTAPRPG